MNASAVFFVCFVICCLGTAVQNKQAFEERATALQGGGKALERTDGETLLCVEMRKKLIASLCLFVSIIDACSSSYKTIHLLPLNMATTSVSLR